MVKVLVLLSAGRDEFSGKAVPSASDARAVKMALNLKNADVTYAHIGSADEPSLRLYLGLGCPEIEVWTLEADASLSSTLSKHLEAIEADLILTGAASSSMASQGLLPYKLASKLSRLLLPGVVSVDLESSRITGVCPAPDRTRRLIAAELPAIATVSPLAPDPGQVVQSWQRSGRIVRETDTSISVSKQVPNVARRRFRAKPLTVPVGNRAWERVRSVIGSVDVAPKARAMSPEQAAQAILSKLEDLGFAVAESSANDDAKKTKVGEDSND
ncbi:MULTISPECIES: hypothetical protein [Rhodobacterales]|uniref:Electron transfer flavoprotein alpha/beta-subunit N-terminal domain-containing protein n=1 Tax=Cognatishimia coralii TaxID=3083254 RepID=A0ABU8QKD7_9RHOB|nr:hypothetical protein [Shimia aestuarii]